MRQPEYDILITIDDTFCTQVREEWLTGIARSALEAETIPLAELGIVITDDITLRRLNRDYAGEDKTTDVLSFSLREGEEFVPPDDVLRLGEVIISFETAERQAQTAGRPTDGEVAHLLVHGILHLLGYDHSGPNEEREMRAREQELLERAGVEPGSAH